MSELGRVQYAAAVLDLAIHLVQVEHRLPDERPSSTAAFEALAMLTGIEEHKLRAIAAEYVAKARREAEDKAVERLLRVVRP
ncbi:MAG TPA: hypothetical protein VMU59_06695 [Caulobacteraceae bacterium]|nr:hypothetical protein [Caulobacteraceae bacterium]